MTSKTIDKEYIGFIIAVAFLTVSCLSCREGFTFPPVDNGKGPNDNGIRNRATQAYFNPGTIPITAATFHSIGIYWRPEEGALNNACSVEFKVSGAETWHWAQDLWFDASTYERYGLAGSYRGSIVNLDPNTTYDIRLTLDSGRTFTITETTWNEDFNVQETVSVPAGTVTFRTSRGGSTEEGYIVYDGGGAVIDVNGSGRIRRGPPDRDDRTGLVLNPDSGDLHNIIIDHSFVVLRNFSLKGATLAAILLSPDVSNVVIESMDISNWGEIRTDRIFGNSRAAIELTRDNTQIVIQRNIIHSPRHSSNNWMQNRSTVNGPGEHPYGPCGIGLEGDVLRDTATDYLLPNGIWNIVVRYNEMYTDDPVKFFEDGIQGSPPDTDIYRNIIRNVVDNALELENGGGRNVRAWENYMYNIYNAISTIPVYIGPMYIWRNISDGYDNFGQAGRARPYKVGGDTYSGTWFERQAARGMHFFYHNINLQADADDGFQQSDGSPLFMIVRNNIVLAQGRSVRGCTSPLIRFSHNLFNASSDVDNPGGLEGYPQWASASGPDGGTAGGWYQLASSSPGFGTAVRLANFNDMFDAPDMGAHQSGTGRLVFGSNAVFIPPPLPAVRGPRPEKLPQLE